MSDKTEEPSPKRLREARAEGNSGVSAYAATALAFLVGVVLVPSAARAMIAWFSAHVREAIGHAADADLIDRSLRFDSWQLAWDILSLSLPVIAAVAAVSAVAQLVQSGGVIATKRIGLQLDRLNVFEGIKNLFSSTQLFAVARGLLGVGAAFYLAYLAMRAHLVDLARLPGRLAYAGPVTEAITRRLARDAALLGLVLGGFDLLVTRISWMKKLRMSKEEVKREHKESEGDPEIKGARKRAHEEMLASATIASVKNATVLVVNPTHIACALRYKADEGDTAPVVVGSGRGELAERMIRAAHEYGVPVVQDVPLARALVELQVGEAIPEALYEAVIVVLQEAAVV